MIEVAYNNIIKRSHEYDMSKYKWRSYLTYEENKGNFIRARVEHFLGTYAEQRLTEYNPKPGAKHMGDGMKIDTIDDVYCAELKRYTGTDNSSSRKSNVLKLRTFAEENNLTPLYLYWEDRPKNDYTVEGIRHLHGRGIFAFWEISEQYDSFMNDIDSVIMEVANLLRERFDEYWNTTGLPL